MRENLCRNIALQRFYNDYTKLNFPDDLWPDENAFSGDNFEKSLNAFFDDRDIIIKSLEKREYDLTKELSHAKGYYFILQYLIIAEHNAYHTGQIALIKKHLVQRAR